MQAHEAVALKGLAGASSAALTALAIVLGVAMVERRASCSPTRCRRRSTTIFASSYAQTDGVVSGRSLADYPTRARRRLAGVCSRRCGTLPRRRGRSGRDPRPQLELRRREADRQARRGDHRQRQPDVRRRRRPVAASASTRCGSTSGRWAARRRRGRDRRRHRARSTTSRSATRSGIAVGGPQRTFTIVGLARYGNVDSLGARDVRRLRPARRRSACSTSRAGSTRSRSPREPASPPHELVARLRAARCRRTAQVQTGDEQAQPTTRRASTGFVGFIKLFLLGFGGIALFVGAFVIFNTLSITVAQRTREFAPLRTLGASRRQVLRSVVLEALVIGLRRVARRRSPLGFGLAKGLSALFDAVGLDLPQAGIGRSRRARCSSPARRRRSSRCSQGCSPPCGRRASRRSRRCARARACRRRGCRGTRTPHRSRSSLSPRLRSALRPVRPRDVGCAHVARRSSAGVLALFVGVALLAPRLVRPIAARRRLRRRRRSAASPGGSPARTRCATPGRTASRRRR